MQVLANCACAFSVLFHNVSVIFLSKTNLQKHMLCLSMTLCAVPNPPITGRSALGEPPFQYSGPCTLFLICKPQTLLRWLAFCSGGSSDKKLCRQACSKKFTLN